MAKTTGQLVSIRDVASIQEYAPIIKGLSDGQKRYLNVMLSSIAKDINWQERAKLANVDVSTAYRMRRNPKWVRAYKELAIVYHQGRVPIIWDHMYDNAINSPHNKDSLDYLKATGSIDDRAGDGARQVNEAAASVLKVAFERYTDEVAERKAREIIKKREVEEG
jgi:hypothetical protein